MTADYLETPYRFTLLPAFSRQLIDNHLREFSEQQLVFARQYNVPLLKFLTQFTDEQLIELTIHSLQELFTFLAEDKMDEHIASSTERWLANQLEIVGKHDIAAEDITLLNHVRGKSMKYFAEQLYPDPAERRQLLSEIDDFLVASTTSSANTYIRILKDQLEEEAEFRSRLSATLPGFIYVYDAKSKVETYSNKKLEEILGYADDELQAYGVNFYAAIMHPGDWVKCMNKRGIELTGPGTSCSFECRMTNVANQYTWLRFYESILKTDAYGGPREVVGVAFDITSEKETSEALAIREEQLLEAQAIAHIGSFEWDIAGKKSATNTPEIFKIFGMSELGKFEEFMEHVHPDDLQMVHDALQESFSSGNYECLYRYMRHGVEKIVWSKGVVTIEDGVATKMIGTVQDVTEIKQMEAALKEKTIALERSNESLQQFAAIASHDLKEPLRKISIHCSRMLDRDESLTGSTREAIANIAGIVARLQKMVDDILLYSFLQTEQEKETVDLEQLLTEVKDLLSQSIQDKQAAIESDGLPTARVIAPQAQQLLQNLLANALKFSRPGVPPEVKITHKLVTADRNAAKQSKQQLVITIADNGIGFSEQENEKIFGLLYRGHSKKQYEGSGLGLSVCKKIVENHGGSISATSVLGEGSTFTIVLPQ